MNNFHTTCTPETRSTTAAHCVTCDACDELHYAAWTYGLTGSLVERDRARRLLNSISPREGREIYAAAYAAGEKVKLRRLAR